MRRRGLIARRGLGLLALLACSACDGRPRNSGVAEVPRASRTGGEIAVLDWSSGLPEQDKPSAFRMSASKQTFSDALRVTESLGDEAHVEAVVVKLGGATLGASRAQELAGSLSALKAKKPVYCHADAVSNVTLMLVTKGCSSVWLSPAGSVESIGLSAQVVYLRKLLVEELHLDVDFLQVGKFKGAEEPMTRDGPSPEARESLMSVLADLRASWLETMAEARPAASASVVEDGPWSAMRAKDLGLIDAVGYADEMIAEAKRRASASHERILFGPGTREHGPDLEDLVRAFAGDSSASGPVALVRATGSISMAGGSGILGGRGGIVEKEFSRTIARLEKDDDVKAVVVRIDSPGGSALASDLMWRGLMKLRKKKPLVFSIGDMAASGGYYLACTGDFIFAEPMSIVGSIGVVGGKVSAGGALERFGVHAETFPANDTNPGAAARAAYESPLVKWDADTRTRVRESMTAVYDLFLNRVSEGRSTRGRDMPRERVAASAEGRIFSGNAGLSRGLVDEIGGLSAAIAKAKELAHLPPRSRVIAVEAGHGFFDSFEMGETEESVRSVRGVRGVRGVREWFTRDTRPAYALEQIAPAATPFVLSLATLVEGDHIALAMPFALMLR
jgi:protease-4